MAFYDDVLEHLGKTPREFGSLQLAVDPAICDAGQVHVTAWLQAAFAPVDRNARLRVSARCADGALLGMGAPLPVPDLGEEGAALRWQIALPLPVPEVTHLLFELTCCVPEKAERVRQAWKLFATVEVPTESELKQSSDGDVGLNVGKSLLGTALMGGAGVFVSLRLGARDSGASLARASSSTSHAARSLPPVEVPILPGAVSGGVGVRVERIWRPGDALPSPVATPALASADPVELPAPPRPTGVLAHAPMRLRRKDVGLRGRPLLPHLRRRLGVTTEAPGPAHVDHDPRRATFMSRCSVSVR